MESARSPEWRDAALAAAIALLLSAVWAVRDWTALSTLHLPDTDDVVRLQQIRDWLGGQAFGDLAQHRLGMGGVEMHWSRLPDLVPAAIIALLTPLTGAYAAELVAVIAWPALLFIAALILTGSIARTLGTSAPTAIVVAALAYPASTLFMPGRIDHHGLQLVLLLVAVRGLLGPGTMRSGVAAGLASAASLIVGMEMAPLLAAGAGVAVIRWIAEGVGERARLMGYGAALSAGLAAAALALRTSGWNYPACDGFAALLWQAAQLGALVPLGLALLSPGLAAARLRIGAAGLLGVSALVAVLAVSPECLRPYGGVDPLLARVWLAQVAEAQPLLAAPAAHAIGYAGLLLAGLGATVWMWWRSRGAGWLIVGALQFLSLLIAFAQLRGAYAGAMLAAPALAGLIGAARMRGAFALAGAWIGSAGSIYPIAGVAVSPQVVADGTPECDAAAASALLARQSRGTVAAPIDLGPYLLATTPHDVLAAPYHRNNAGNRAVYRLMLLSEPAAAAWAQRVKVTYLLGCPAAFAELGSPPRGSLLAALAAGRTPSWLNRLSPDDAETVMFAVSRSADGDSGVCGSGTEMEVGRQTVADHGAWKLPTMLRIEAPLRNWLLCWIFLPNVAFAMFWLIGAPPRQSEIVLTGAVGLLVRRAPYPVRLAAFAAVTLFSLLSYIAAIFNLAVSEIVASLRFFMELDVMQSPVYLAGCGVAAAMLGIGAYLLRRNQSFAGKVRGWPSLWPLSPV